MKVDVKHAKVDGIWDGSSISIETGDAISITRDAKFVGIHTNNVPEWAHKDELWIFKRKAFLKAVSKALDVTIFEREDDDDIIGYYE